jgi:hypothetical protein
MNQILPPTHAELVEQFRTPGFELSHCPGELEHVGSHPDRCLDGVHQIGLYRCERCGVILSLDANTAQLRNVYRPELPR